MFLKLFRGSTAVKSILFTSYSTLKQSIMEPNLAGLSISMVIDALEAFAPKKLSESWDNTGLLVEPYTSKGIKKILLTNDLTEEVALEATSQSCDMIISYHPPIFAPLKSVTQHAWKERIVSLLLEHRIALYSPHTSWDAVRGGVNDWLASAFPYGESQPVLTGETPDVGAGRHLQLKNEITLADAIKRVKQLTGLQYVRFAIGKGKVMDSGVATVALCAGSGASVLKGVSADLFLTGEMLHHDILDATQKGISVILTNHSDSERGFLHIFQKELTKTLENKVDVYVSKCDRDPLTTV